jgi:hypothetical protein
MTALLYDWFFSLDPRQEPNDFLSEVRAWSSPRSLQVVDSRRPGGIELGDIVLAIDDRCIDGIFAL